MNNIAVIGLGNISKRHRANLRALYPEAKIFAVSASGRMAQEAIENADEFFSSIDDVLSYSIDMAIVASPAPYHISQASQLIKAGIPVLIEKPLSDSLKSFSMDADIFLGDSQRIEVGYNLRFMPSAVELKRLIDEGLLGAIYSVSVDVGQYLPHWRPISDYRSSVSARKELGGGVLLELSHEIDYLLWLFGPFDTAYCLATNTGSLDINVEDRVDAILHQRDGLVVNLHMDFLQRRPVRTCKIVGKAGTLLWDILHNSIYFYTSQSEEKTLYSEPDYDRNIMYLEELVRFSRVAKGELKPKVDVAQALRSLRLIEALKYSSEAQQVVNIGEAM